MGYDLKGWATTGSTGEEGDWIYLYLVVGIFEVYRDIALSKTTELYTQVSRRIEKTSKSLVEKLNIQFDMPEISRILMSATKLATSAWKRVVIKEYIRHTYIS